MLSTLVYKTISMLFKTKLLIASFLYTAVLVAQQKPKEIKSFTQKDFEVYKFEENKYDLWTKDWHYHLFTENDTTSYFLDSSGYKGILNYGVNFSLKDKRVCNFIENYKIYYTTVIIEKCTFSVSDSIVEIEGQLKGGWSTIDWSSADFKGKPPLNIAEIAVGELKKSPSVINFRNFNSRYYSGDSIDYIITFKGEEKNESFPLDTLNTLVFKKLNFKKELPASAPFKVSFKVDKNSVLSISKLSCYTHFFNIGEMIFAKQRKKGIIAPEKSKDASRFVKIIEDNVQVNDPKNQIKKEIPPYYQLTEKAEGYILTRQYAKAKETYSLLAKDHKTLFARDIHNAIRVALLSRDINTAFWWGEKLAAKGIESPYFNAKLFGAMRNNVGWKTFKSKYDSICKASQNNWKINLKQQVNDLLNEDQADYGLENRKESQVLYETTERVTDKFIALLQKEGYPSEEKIGAFTKNDTTLIQSPEFMVIIRHAIQQKPKNIKLLNELLEKSYASLEYDSKRSTANRMFPQSCFHIYKGNLYNSKSCTDSNTLMVKKMIFMFNNPNGFIMDNGDYIVSEYNKESPEEYDKFYANNFDLVMKLTDDWEFYEK